MSEATNNNMEGVNGHKDCPPKGNKATEGHLREYHRQGKTNRKEISKLLFTEHGIVLSATSVDRRRKTLGLMGSRITTKAMPEVVKQQLILDAMALDPKGQQGPRTIREAIIAGSSTHLTRDSITREMKKQAPEGFAAREPTAKTIRREPLVSLGPHHEWSADGHDKLAAMGFPIWGVRDKWCGKWLGLWVMPNNRLKLAIAMLYLRLIEEYGGVAIQTTTDCRSETTKVFEIANLLRELFAEHLSAEELVLHRFLQSIHNITIERGWLRIRLQWGDNVKAFWDSGCERYNKMDPTQQELIQWLWPTLIQQELDELKDRLNNHIVRYDPAKKLPSGMSPNMAYALHVQEGGEWCLQDVDLDVIRDLKEEMGGEELLRFVSVEYEERAQKVFDSLDYGTVSFLNVWEVFSEMLPLM